MEIAPPQTPFPGGTPMRVHVTVGDWAPSPGDCLAANTTHPDWDFRWEGGAAGALAAAAIRQLQGVAVIPATELRVPEYVIRVTATPRFAGPAVQTRTVAVPILTPPVYDPGPAPVLSVTVHAERAAVHLATPPARWRPTRPGGLPLQFCFMLQSPEGLLLPIPEAPDFSPSPRATVPLPWLPHSHRAPSTYTFALLVRDAHATQTGPFFANASVTGPAPRCAAACARTLPRALLRDVACGLCSNKTYRPDSDLLRALDGLSDSTTRHRRLGVLHEAALVALRFGDRVPSKPPGLTLPGGLAAARRLVKAAAPILDDDASVAWLLRVCDALLYSGDGAVAAATAEGVPTDLVLTARRQRDPCVFQGLAVQSRHLQAALHRVPLAWLPTALHLPDRGIAAELPADVRRAVEGRVSAGVADVVATAVPPTGLLVTDVVAVSLWDPSTGREVPVHDSSHPPQGAETFLGVTATSSATATQTASHTPAAPATATRSSASAWSATPTLPLSATAVLSAPHTTSRSATSSSAVAPARPRGTSRTASTTRTASAVPTATATASRIPSLPPLRSPAPARPQSPSRIDAPAAPPPHGRPPTGRRPPVLDPPVEIAPPQTPFPGGTPMRVHVTVGDWAPSPGDCLAANTTHPDWDFRWEGGAAGALAAAAIRQLQGVAVIPATELRVPEYVIRVTATPRFAGPAVQTRTVAVPILTPPVYDPGPAPVLSVTVHAERAAVHLATPPARWRPTRPGGLPLQFCFMLQSPEGLLLPIPEAPDFSPSPRATVPLPWLPHSHRTPSTYTFALLVRDAHATQTGPFFANASVTGPAPRCAAACARTLPRALLRDVACGLCSNKTYRPDSDLLRALDGLSDSTTRHRRLGVLHEAALVALRFGDRVPSKPPGLTLPGGLAAARRLVKAAAPILDDDASVAWLLRVCDALLYSGDGAVAAATAEGVPTDLVLTARRQRDPCVFQGLAVQSRHLQAALHRVPLAWLPTALHLPDRGIAAELPADVRRAVEGRVSAGVADVVATAVPPTGLLVTDVVAVSLWDPSTGREVPVHDSSHPPQGAETFLGVTATSSATATQTASHTPAAPATATRSSASAWSATPTLPLSATAVLSAPHTTSRSATSSSAVAPARPRGTSRTASTTRTASAVPTATATASRIPSLPPLRSPAPARPQSPSRIDAPAAPPPHGRPPTGRRPPVLDPPVEIAPPQTPFPGGTPMRVHVTVGDWAPSPGDCLAANTTHPDWDFRWEGGAAGALAAAAIRQLQGVAVIPATELRVPEYVIRVTATPRFAGPAVQTRTVAVPILTPPVYDPGPAPVLSVTVHAERAAVHLATPPARWRPTRPGGLPLQFCFMLQSPEGLLLPIPEAPDFSPSPRATVPLPWLPHSHRAPSTYTFALLVRDAHATQTGPFFANASVTGPAPRCAAACARTLPRALLRDVACGLCSNKTYRPDSDLLRALDGLSDSTTRHRRLGVLHEAALVALRFGDRVPSKPPGLTLPGGLVAARRLVKAAAPILDDDASVAWLLRVCDALLYSGDGAVAAATAEGVLTDLVLTAWRQRDPCVFQGLAVQSRHLQAALHRVPLAWLPTAMHLPDRGIAAELPADVRRAVEGRVSAGVADVVATAVPPTGLLVTDVVAVSLWDPSTGREVPVHDLREPITIRFGAALHSPRFPPAADRFQCVYAAPGGWSPDGTWLSPAHATAGEFACHVAHLTSFAVQALPDVAEVRGCGLDLPPSTLLCGAAPPPLTIAGAHFGPAAARVTLERQPDGLTLPCPAVRHVLGAEDETLLCEDLRLPDDTLEPRWFDVTVSTAQGTNATLPRALLSTGYPELAALEALDSPAGGCAQATPQALRDCPRAATRFGLHGHFHIHGYFGTLTVHVGPFQCPVVASINATYLECDGLTGAGQALPVVVAAGGTPSNSTGVTLSFREPCVHKPGLWAGPGCLDCQPGYYGPGCAQPCPGLAAGAVCGGHGTCSDGPGGSGRCACTQRDPTGGYWGGEGCGDCGGHYWGAHCNTSCASPAGLICSGHGICDSRATADGGCHCTNGFVGVHCELRCPQLAGQRPCWGHGTCTEGPVLGVGLCEYYGDPINGHWAAPECRRCAAGWVGEGCTLPCPVSDGLPCAGHGECKAPAGVAVCECVAGYVGPDCTHKCPREASSEPCSGHGRCEFRAGAAACACDPQWAGATCVTCAAGWAGVDCMEECPANAAGAVCGGHGLCVAAAACQCDGGYCGADCAVAPAVCAASPCPAGRYGPQCDGVCRCGVRGVCLEGRHGTGHCVCAAGWAGGACDVPCEGGTIPVCGGHGRCDARTGACVCNSAWRSLPGWLVCGTACPGPLASPCNGHGSCTSAAQCVCDAGFYGSDCSGVCAVDEGGVWCTGHGRCDGAAGCVCAANWAGAACDACAAGYWGPACEAACRNGVSVARQCVCDVHWAGPDCAVRCPFGSQGDLCSGHGVCNSSSAGDGACLCQAGYVGPTCGHTCQGGADMPCGGHGTCSPVDGSCACFNSTAGHWTGPDCGACAAPYYGLHCNLQCPRDAAGRMCGGHGECRDASGCTCHSNHTHGAWDGPLCAACAPGRFGADCRGLCPMHDCVACSGHGVCRDGAAGDGQCVCAGRWAGDDCSRCAAGYWGLDCARECAGGAASPCGGHGVCSEGPRGTGECACFAGPHLGWWVGATCAACRAGYYGRACAEICGCVPAQGTCDDGLNGTGACQCLEGYRGETCSLECPVFQGRICNGIGTCTANATCDCDSGAGGRHFAGPACDACAPGFTGAACDLRCPADGQGRVCAGVGECRADAGVPVCDCQRGFHGATCEAECPGGALLPCTGHGVCSSGVCACNASATTGHWAGANCSTCVPGWSGSACDIPCPVGPDGVPCSGYECRQGQCMCALVQPPKCGLACNVSWEDCQAFVCPEGWYGPDCGFACPGADAAQGVCSGHGSCLARVYGTGLCACDTGYAGDKCQWGCPTTSEGAVCSGHGLCTELAAGCVCFEGYGGHDCSRGCPLHRGLVCSGHGTCSSGVGDGRCVCDRGYGGADCGAQCPGFDPTADDSRVCAGHGECLAATAECRCDETPGRWAGVRCDACAWGWFGPECTDKCVYGATVQQVCLVRCGRVAAFWALCVRVFFSWTGFFFSVFSRTLQAHNRRRCGWPTTGSEAPSTAYD